VIRIAFDRNELNFAEGPDELEKAMKDFAILFGVAVLWIALNRWVLPWFGVQTCMSGGCSVQNARSPSAAPMLPNEKETLEAKGEPK
jgi:hypothetical protein